VAIALRARERGSLGRRHAFKEIEAAIIFGDMGLAEMHLALATPLGRRKRAFQFTIGMFTDTGFPGPRFRGFLGRGLYPDVGKLDAVAEGV